MGIQEVIKTINQLQADRVIESYAIGGAVGATFYLEPNRHLRVDSDLQKLFERKREFRRELAARPIVEKLRMLDVLRERELAIRRRAPSRKEQSPPKPEPPKDP